MISPSRAPRLLPHCDFPAATAKLAVVSKLALSCRRRNQVKGDAQGLPTPIATRHLTPLSGTVNAARVSGALTWYTISRIAMAWRGAMVPFL